MLLANSIDVMPSWMDVQSLRDEITPPSNQIEDPFVGVMFNLTDAAHMTVKRILQIESVTFPTSEDFVLNIKYGFDGSGSHAIFNLLGNCETNNIIMALFCPLSISN